MSEFQLFLAHSFAPQRMNANGDEDPNGISDMQIADLIEKWVLEFSHQQIQVVRTHDPHRDYISSQVRKDISRSDFVLCLFTKRTKDCLKNLWLASSYVVSESSAALMQFPNEQETHNRLFGIVEEGVDTEQLGMAFHRNKTAESFRRDRLDELKLKIKAIVENVRTARVKPRENREYLSLDKTVSVFRNGSVLVECRHRFRFTAEMTTVKVPHTIWRISKDLPEITELRSSNAPNGVVRPASATPGFLRCFPVLCGPLQAQGCRCRIVPTPATSLTKNERNFAVEFTNVKVKPGDELMYEIVWSYPNAFSSCSKISSYPNSVGVRTGERGMAQSSSLTLKFERVLDDDHIEPDRILEEPPTVFHTDTTLLPSNQDSESFWHLSPTWREVEKLTACPKKSGAMFEVYRWNSDCFLGMAKAVWNTHMNYFQTDSNPTTSETSGGKQSATTKS